MLAANRSWICLLLPANLQFTGKISTVTLKILLRKATAIKNVAAL